MAALFDKQVFEELASTLEGISPFPNPDEYNSKFYFKFCRGFKQGSSDRCGNFSCTDSERKEHADLLSEFPVMAKCVDTNSLYDKMEKLITLMYCRRNHRGAAYDAFIEWKAQRKTAASISAPITPSRSAMPRSGSFESLPNLSSKTSPSTVPRNPEYDELSSDFYITEKMKNLKLATPAQKTQVETDDSCFDEVEVQTEKLNALGVAHMPVKGMGYENKKIYNTIRNPLSAKAMSGAIVYVLEHTEISGLFKIGYTKTSADLRLKQPGNCYRFKTRVIYETEGGRFKGARQAERIAHAILDHKRITFYECPICIGYHEEWFLVSRKEACSAVKLAEQWLKMPAYVLQDGRYKLTPEGDTISQKMFPFSIPDIRALIDNTGKSDNNFDAMAGATSAGAIRETGANVSSTAAEKEIPRIFVDESHTIMSSIESLLQERSPVRGIGDKGVRIQVEIEEISERRERRSRSTTPKGNFIIVEEHKTIRRRRVSITDLQQNDGGLDLKDKKQGDKAVADVW